ncbi:hypothetical protein D3C81_176440 [compost metagenome]
MANKVTPSIPPGAFPSAQTINWSFDPAVQQVAYSVNGLPPALSSYIAYDSLVPPNPFIAVTQDGTGNVVYDGGFPKFYNTFAPLDTIVAFPAALRIQGERAASGTDNSFVYCKINDVRVDIVAGDRLVYDMWASSAVSNCGVDGMLNGDDMAPLRHAGITDQNGLLIHPSTDTTAQATNKWYHRDISLSSLAGGYIDRWSFALENQQPGVHVAYLKSCFVLDSVGNVKATLFNGTLNFPSGTLGLTASAFFSNISTRVVDHLDQLAGSFKYLANCLKFIANPVKVAAGNKKILFLGDQISTVNYAVKATGTYGFLTSIQRICALTGFVPTVKDIDDYGGAAITTNLTELNQYCAVVLFSTAYDLNNAARITPSAVTDINTFRQQGNGIALITDHGTNVQTDIMQVNTAAGAGFYGTANRIATQYGAFFTGNYDRTPVNVGFLRSTYGDHPLYNGMDNSEAIIAGGSESKVIVTPATLIAPGAMPNTTMNSGANTIRFLVKLADGSVETYTFVYNVASGEIIEFKDAQGNDLTTVDVGWNYRAKPQVKLIGAGLGTLSGSIYRNGLKVGETYFDEAGGAKELWYSGDAIPVKNGDTIQATIDSPFTYSRTLNVVRKQPNTFDINALANIVRNTYGSAPLTIRSRIIEAAMAGINPFYPMVYSPAHAKNIYQLRQYMEDRIPLSDANVFAYDTNAAVTDAIARLVPPTPAQIFNNWARFNGDAWFPKGTPPTGDAAAWYWDEALGSAVQPLNTAGWTGFVSDYDVLDYDLEVTLKSTNGDDDFIGVVLGFVRDDATGQNHTLDFVLTRGANNYDTRPVWPNQILCTDFQYKNTWATQTGRYKELSFLEVVDTPGWSGAYKRVKIQRRGDQFSIQASAWSSLTYDPAYNMSFNLNDIPELAKFKGAHPIGFGAMSQPAATFSDLVFSDGFRRDIILDMLNNRIYRYLNGSWQLATGVTIHQAFGAPRIINAIEGNKRYQLNANGTITVL